MKFTISDFLDERDKVTNKGSCKSCSKRVKWSRVSVASHKRKNCLANDEEKRFFAIEKSTYPNLNNGSVSDDSLSSDGMSNEQMSFPILEFLDERDKETNKGSCKSCGKFVKWSRDSVASHKRKNCLDDDEEARYFAKRNRTQSSLASHTLAIDENLPHDKILNEQELTDEKKEEINTKFAKFFFRTGIPLTLADCETFKDFVTALHPAYAESMPNAHTLSGQLLDQEYQQLADRRDKFLHESHDLVLVSDGWTNVRGDHIVNFCVKAPNLKPFFYKSINTSETRDDAEAVSELILTVIDEIGSDRFTCVITDNAPVMKAAWKLIEERYPHITAYGCAAHIINLLINDILNTPKHQKTIEASEAIIQFVNNHHLFKAKFEEEGKAAGVVISLSSPVSSRWNSQYTSSSSLLKAKYVLMRLADESSDDLTEVVPKIESELALNLMKSFEFWERLATLVKTIEYPTNVIDKFENEDAPLCLVYYEFGELYKNFEHSKTLQEMVKKRFDLIFTESMGLAFMLTPKYAADGFYFGDHQIEILSFIGSFLSKRNSIFIEQASAEIISFTSKMTTLSEQHKDVIFKMSAKQYWNVFGRRDFPALFIVAKSINEMICSSATSERIWSIYKLVHSRLCNGLPNEKAEKLVSIYVNCTILDENDLNDYILEQYEQL